MLTKFNLSEEIKKNLNSWELFVAETYNRALSKLLDMEGDYDD